MKLQKKSKGLFTTATKSGLCISNMLIILMVMVLTSSGQTSQMVETCKKRNVETQKILPRNSVLYGAIQAEQIGDGIRTPWRTDMKWLGIRHALFVVDFDYTDGTIEFATDSISLYRTYYDFSEKSRINLAASPEIDRIRRRLESEAFIIAHRQLIDVGINFEKIKKERICGRYYLELFDDECLPLIHSTASTLFFENCDEKSEL